MSEHRIQFEIIQAESRTMSHQMRALILLVSLFGVSSCHPGVPKLRDTCYSDLDCPLGTCCGGSQKPFCGSGPEYCEKTTTSTTTTTASSSSTPTSTRTRTQLVTYHLPYPWSFQSIKSCWFFSYHLNILLELVLKRNFW